MFRKDLGIGRTAASGGDGECEAVHAVLDLTDAALQRQLVRLGQCLSALLFYCVGELCEFIVVRPSAAGSEVRFLPVCV